MKLKQVESDGVPVYAAFDCPGCGEPHLLPLDQGWSFNGDWSSPTFSPSFVLTGTLINPGEDFVEKRCHFFVRSGRVEYLGDCNHDRAGTVFELPEVDPEEPIF